MARYGGCADRPRLAIFFPVGVSVYGVNCAAAPLSELTTAQAVFAVARNLENAGSIPDERVVL